MSDLTPIEEYLPKEPRRPRRKAMTLDEMPLTPGEELVLRLVEVGVGLRKAEDLVRRYPAERIGRQLDWLPFRTPRRPASLLISAIEHDYDAPAYGGDDE